MTLTLRTMDKHAQLMGWGDHWGKDDFVILDRDRKSVGRIHEDTTHDARWIWSVNTSPYPAPAPHNGLAPTLESSQRYEEMTLPS
jgi:hypothetical protein